MTTETPKPAAMPPRVWISPCIMEGVDEEASIYTKQEFDFLIPFISKQEHEALLAKAVAEARAGVHEEESRLWRHTFGDASFRKETLIEYHDRKANEIREKAKAAREGNR